MENLAEIRNAFQDYRKNDTKSTQLLGLTPDAIFDEAMVNGLLSHVLLEMKVQAKPESVLATSSNIQVSDTVSSEQDIIFKRDEFDLHHVAPCLSADQNIQVVSQKANETIKFEASPSNEYTQSVRKKFLLLFSMFAVSAKQQQASLRKDFFQQLADHLKSSKAVEKRVQMGIDFACQFQLGVLQQTTSDEAKIQVFEKIYDILKQAGDGDLFGHDKFSFIIDRNLDQISAYLQNLLGLKCQPAVANASLKVLMQLGRVRSNPADYLACINARNEKGELIKVDMSEEMGHIFTELSNFAVKKQSDKEDKVNVRTVPTDFKEAHSLNRGTLFYYKAGTHKLDITSLDCLATDGHNMYHLKRGKGLFKLGFGDGIQKMSGFVKDANTSDAVKSMESTSMVLFQDKLYIRHYDFKPYPFQVYDSQTLQIDQPLTEKFKSHFELTLKGLEKQNVEQQAPEENTNPVTHRSLLWHKDARSGRTLEISPMFTDGNFLYCVAFQKQQIADRSIPILVVELYNIKSGDFTFVKQIPLLNKEGTEPFIYDSNNLNFLRSSQWMTNGEVIGLNVPNVTIYFFDLQTGNLIAEEKSESILMCHDLQSNKIFSVKSLQGTHQTLFEVAYNGFKKNQQAEAGNGDSEQFSQVESNFISELISFSKIKEQAAQSKYDTLIESIIYGSSGLKQKMIQSSDQKVTDEQIRSQHTLILKYLDARRAQAVLKLPHLDFINIFKYPNVTYLSGPTFSALITAAAQQQIGPFDLLYSLRLLQCNFTALTMCQGSLPEIMRDNQDQYKRFFELYNSVLRQKVYDKPCSIVESEIQRVCIEIMQSSINILYESNQDIANKFLSELKENSGGINCNIFFDYFSQVENFQKLLSYEIKGMVDIFEATCQIQLKFVKDKISDDQEKQPEESQKSDLASCRFFKVCSYHTIISYTNQLEKVSDRQKSKQKVPQALLEKQMEEDNRILHLQNLTFSLFTILNSYFKQIVDLLGTVKVPEDKEPAILYLRKLKRLLLHKSPFAQMYLNVYCQIFTVLSLYLQQLPQVVKQSLEVIAALQLVSKMVSEGRFGQLWSDLSQQDNPFNFICEFTRTLSYLVASKAYILTKAETKNEIQNTVETQLLQSNVLSGGIDPYFEAQFSQETLKMIGQYSRITDRKLEVQSKNDYDILLSIIEPSEASDIHQALDLLQKNYLKEKGMALALIGREAGLRLSRAAFAVLLKLQDQQEAFKQLIELRDLELLEVKEKEALCFLYSVASQMRKWTHEAKNTLSEKIDNEVESRHRKDKEARLLAVPKVVKAEPSEVQIDTTNAAETQDQISQSVQQKFFSEEELDAIKEEQEKTFNQEIALVYDSVIEKAKYLIRIQAPSLPVRSNFSKFNEGELGDLLSNWKESQKEIGNIKSLSTKEKEIRIACSGEVLTILQLSCSVQRIQQRVEEVYVAAHRRMSGLHIFQQLVDLLVPVWSKNQLTDTLSWFCAALRENKNQKVHYLQGLTGCGLSLEAQARDYFFKILIRVVEKLRLENNSDSDIGFLISCLKWKFLGRDHDALSDLQLFSTLHRSQRLKVHWGKPIPTDFESQEHQSLKFELQPSPDKVAMIRQIFDRHDGNKSGTLNYAEAKDFLKELSNLFSQSWDQNDQYFDQMFNKIQKDNRVSFEILYKTIQLKKSTSQLAGEILAIFELLFSSSITRLVESDVGASLKLSSQQPAQLNKAKSVLNQNKSDVLLGEMFEVVFQELSRYLHILQIQKGVDWTIYAQKRSVFAEIFEQSVDAIELLDIQNEQKPTISPVFSLDKVQSENDEERKAKEILAEQAKVEERQKAHLKTIPGLYSENFLLRLLRLVLIFTSVSISASHNLLCMVQRIANPSQMAVLLQLLVQGAPKIKITVIKIFTNLVKIELPFELYEETINLHLQQPESSVAQILKRIQPAIQFRRCKFLSFVHQYILSIRQKLWTKSAVESQSQYEISCELLKFMRVLYESQKSLQHPWRVEINEVVAQTLSDSKKLSRARETEVVLGFLRGADFNAIAPYSQVSLKGKQYFTVLGYVNRDWLKRNQNTVKQNLVIHDTMASSEQKVLLISEQSKGELLKLVNPERLNVLQSVKTDETQYKFTSEMLKSLFDSTDLASGSSEDIQQLSNKCLILKLIDNQLASQPKEFIAALRSSGHYETLFKLVGKESSLEIKGDIVLLSWLEQHCYNIRKMACENQNSLLKPQEARMSLVKDKIYAFVVDPNSKGEKSYLRVKLQSALNYNVFVQRKEIKLVNAIDMMVSDDQESQSEQFVALVDPSDLLEENGLEVLNRSIGIITHSSDLQRIVSLMTDKHLENNEKYQDLLSKTVFLVSPAEFVKLSGVCSGETANQKNETADQDSTFDQVYADELIKYGGFSQAVAQKTKQAQGVENKTKALFNVMEQISNGQSIHKEEDHSEQKSDVIRRDNKPAEDTFEIQQQLIQRHQESKERAHPDSTRSNSSTFFKTTKVESNSDLADLFEKSIRRLFNKLCRNIFWNMIQKDKIAKIFDFLLTTPEDMRTLVTFLKVIGNECYITENKQHIKGFTNFVKQVIQTSVQNPKFQPLVEIIIDDLIDSYRKALPELAHKPSYISTVFRTESQAGKLMNPFIVIPVLKCLLRQSGGFNLIQSKIEHLISILITINSTFIGDYKLKDQYWLYIVALLDKSQELEAEQVERILRLEIVKTLFEPFEYQHAGTQSGTLRLQRIYREDTSSEIEGIPRNQPWKIVNQGRESRQRRFTQHQNRSMDHLMLLEVLYKFYLLSQKVPTVNFFFNNTLSRFLQMHGSLLQQGPAGELSRHLLFSSQVPLDKKLINETHTVDFKSQSGPHLIECSESSKFMVHLTETSQLKPGQQILLSNDKDGRSEIALFNQKQIRTNCAFETVYSDKVFMNVVFPKQNFVVRLSQNELQPENLEFRIKGTILNSYQNRMFLTEEGVFKVHSQDLLTPEKDHLVMKQVTFGKSCTVALLSNGSIIGYGQSKHRHFINKPNKTTSETENVIPINLKLSSDASQAAQTKEILALQRQVEKLKTFKRTSVCITASGHVFAVGDKFAKQIKLPADAFKAFGFYQLPVATLKLQKEEDKPKEEPENPKKEDQEDGKVPDSVLGSLFGEPEAAAELEKPLEEVKVEDQQPDQSNSEPNIETKEETKSLVSDDEYKSVQSQEAKPDTTQEEQQPLNHSSSEAMIETNQVEIEVKSGDDEPAEEEKVEDDNEKDEGSEYVPKEDSEEAASKQDEKEEIVQPVESTYTAVDVWISETGSSKHIVVLVLFKSSNGAYEFRTIGNNPNGLLGQGKDRKESVELHAIDFGVELKQIAEVVVGYQHFIVRADGKVYAWGCYSSDSEEKVIWQPRELTFFQSHKVKKLSSGEMFTCALVEQVGQPDYFICGKFAPMWQENQYKSLKYFAEFQIDNFHVQGQNLIVSTKEKVIDDFSDIKVEYSVTPDFTFRPSEKLKTANQEINDKLQSSLTLEKPELQSKLISLIEAQIFARIKDHDFDQVQWQDINLEELKIDESFGLNDDQKRSWLLLVVNYCKHIWAYISLVGGQFKKTDFLPIYQNFIQYRKNVPMCLKNKYLKIILQDLSKDDKGNSIHISRKRALELRKEGQVDTKGEWTVFAQVSRELRKNKFHGMHINSQNKRAWFVKFIGEAALDDGGLFRESITELCSELQSTALELFIPSANQVSKIGDNRDKWVLNPQANSDMHLKMYEFVGSLFGMCVRSGILLNLNLAPIFWKTLTKDPLTVGDIKDVDLKFVQNLETYAKCKKDGVSEDQFKKDHELTMTCLNSAQKVVELVKNGSKKEVSYHNLDSFIQKCIGVRLSECREQYKSILKGFDQTFDSSYLKVLSWQDLELKVVGNEEVDIERLKEITTYSKCSPTHEVIKKFWKVLTSFENEDRKRYLRFVWGRTRLPLKEDTDIELHTIQLDENRSKTDTPFGRTCYFRLELPPYQSEAVLRERLLFAITNCTSIDGDYERNYNVDESQQNQQPAQAERERVDGSDSEQERRDDEERQRLRERHNDYGSEGSGNEDNQDDHGEEEVEEE